MHEHSGELVFRLAYSKQFCCTSSPQQAAQQAWLGTQVDPPVDLDVISQIQHPRPDLQNLILVACHAVFIGPDYTKAEDQSSWLLLDYQKVMH